MACYKCPVSSSLMGPDCKTPHVERKKKEEPEYKICEAIEPTWSAVICDGSGLKAYNLFIDISTNGGLT